MMSFDAPGAGASHLWNVLPIASAIREFSNYSLVVLTNHTHWLGNVSVADSLAKLGVVVYPVEHVPVPEHMLQGHQALPCELGELGNMDSRASCGYQFLKLQIWRLPFEKVIWLDSDGIVTRSLDHLFELPGTWGQQDNWFCGSPVQRHLWPPFSSLLSYVERVSGRDLEVQSASLCSGMLVIEPSEETYQGIVQYLSQMPSVPKSDQQVVEEYFTRKLGKPAKLLNTSIASFGQCIGRRAIPGGGLPSFVHKFDESNTCFRVNARPEWCRRSRVARIWRRHFCEAAEEAELAGPEVQHLCGPLAQIIWEDAGPKKPSSLVNQ